jgi:hypothetical protein
MSATAKKQPKCPVSIAFNLEAEPILLYCKRWSCPHCARTLAQRWAKRARAVYTVHPDGVIPDQWFLTLTLSSYYRTADQGFVALPKLWDKTRKAFQRSFKKWQYLAFVEGQPERDDMPHFHILCAEKPPAKLGKNGTITKHTLHDWAIGLGWGFEVELKPVDSAGAALYVAKYASKQSPVTPAGFRRVRCSRDWPQGPADPIMPIIRRNKGETLGIYVNRVANRTGHTISDVLSNYMQASQKLAQILEQAYTKV